MGNLKLIFSISFPALEAGVIAALIIFLGGNSVFLTVTVWLIIIATILGGKWALMVTRGLPLEPCVINLTQGTFKERLEWLSGSAIIVLLFTEAWIGALFGFCALLLFA